MNTSVANCKCVQILMRFINFLKCSIIIFTSKSKLKYFISRNKLCAQFRKATFQFLHYWGGYSTASYHGFSGPLKVENKKWRTKVTGAFLKAGEELGYAIIDPNGASQIGKNMINFTRCQQISEIHNLSATFIIKYLRIFRNNYTNTAYNIST